MPIAKSLPNGGKPVGHSGANENHAHTNYWDDRQEEFLKRQPAEMRQRQKATNTHEGDKGASVGNDLRRGERVNDTLIGIGVSRRIAGSTMMAPPGVKLDNPGACRYQTEGSLGSSLLPQPGSQSVDSVEVTIERDRLSRFVDRLDRPSERVDDYLIIANTGVGDAYSIEVHFVHEDGSDAEFPKARIPSAPIDVLHEGERREFVMAAPLTPKRAKSVIVSWLDESGSEHRVQQRLK